MIRTGLLLVCLWVWGCQPTSEDKPEYYTTWSHYLGDPGRSHFSELQQINKQNVGQLEVAWEYKSGDLPAGDRSQIQCNPIVVDGVLYATTPTLKLIALQADSGAELWSYQPADTAWPGMGVNRGVTFWKDDSVRQITYSVGPNLYAVNAMTGKPVTGFGKEGKVDLREGLGRDPEKLLVLANTPGAVFEDLLIQGTRVGEGPGSAPGHVRAYNLKTGAIAWTFKTIPEPGEFGYDTWPEDAYQYIGGANSWSGITLDQENEIVFVPTGSAAFDFFGGNRVGSNLFANCLIALNARTGERIWHFQFVHHDIWDRDLPAPPNLVTIQRDGATIPAVAQVTKSGHVFLFHRLTGAPIFPIEEQPVPPSTVEGEVAWSTQPIPTKPPPFARQVFTEDMLNTIVDDTTSWLQDFIDNPQGEPQTIREQLAKVETGRPYIPISLQGTIMFPGFDGGAEWGGAAYDPTGGILYVNSNEMPWIFSLNKLESTEITGVLDAGKQLYGQQCARCHGAELQGEGSIPALIDLQDRLSSKEIMDIMGRGQGVMPAFNHLSDHQIAAIDAFLRADEAVDIPIDSLNINDPASSPYGMRNFGRFLTKDGYPAIAPPWGTLNAIDLNAGEIKWQVPLGEFDELTEKGIAKTGTENYGGPVVTAGGLIFIASTKDQRIRAFDKDTGEEVWQDQLPYGGYATPSTYEVNGKQYLVIACGGGKMGTPSGDVYRAYALGRQNKE